MKPPAIPMPLLAPILLLIAIPVAQRTFTMATTAEPATGTTAVNERAALRALANRLRTERDSLLPVRVTWTDTDKERPIVNSAVYYPTTGRLSLMIEGSSTVETSIPQTAILAADENSWAGSFSGVTGFAYRMRRATPADRRPDATAL